MCSLHPNRTHHHQVLPHTNTHPLTDTAPRAQGFFRPDLINLGYNELGNWSLRDSPHYRDQRLLCTQTPPTFLTSRRQRGWTGLRSISWLRLQLLSLGHAMFSSANENAPGGSGPHSLASQDPCLTFPVHSPGVLPTDMSCSSTLTRLCTWCFSYPELPSQDPLKSKLYSEATWLGALPRLPWVEPGARFALIAPIIHLCVCLPSQTQQTSWCYFQNPTHLPRTQ